MPARGNEGGDCAALRLELRSLSNCKNLLWCIFASEAVETGIVDLLDGGTEDVLSYVRWHSVSDAGAERVGSNGSMHSVVV